MSSLAAKFRIGRFGILLAAGLGVAAVTMAAKPAEAGVWIGVEVPVPSYAPPPAPYGYVYGYPYAYGYAPAYVAPPAYYRRPAYRRRPDYGYATGFYFGGGHDHREWRGGDHDDRD